MNAFASQNIMVAEIMVRGDDGHIRTYLDSVFDSDASCRHTGKVVVDYDTCTYLHLPAEIHLDRRENAGILSQWFTKHFCKQRSDSDQIRLRLIYSETPF